MKAKILVLAGIGLLVSASSGFTQENQATQPEYGWKPNVVGLLNLTQASFDNWVQGGDNNFAWQVNLSSKIVNEQEKYTWSTTGKFSYGRTKVANGFARKSIDEIKLESVYTYRLGTLVNPYVSVTALTQFTEGFKYTGTTRAKISNFLDPGYFTESLGIGVKPVTGLETRLGLAFKQTVTNDYPIPYADDPKTTKIEKIRSEVGMSSTSNYSGKVSANILLTSALEVFTNFKGIKVVDVSWDNTFSAKVAKYLEVNFNIRLLYDRDTSPKRQLYQALAVGLTYRIL